jgi:four helix bundle protein
MRHHFKSLKIWQLGMDLVVLVYSITKKFPAEERFGLVSQMNRCAVSIPSNIAEGSAKNSDDAFSLYLSHSLGSLYELETQVILSQKLEIIEDSIFSFVVEKINELEKMIIGFINKLKNNPDSRV